VQADVSATKSRANQALVQERKLFDFEEKYKRLTVEAKDDKNVLKADWETELRRKG